MNKTLFLILIYFLALPCYAEKTAQDYLNIIDRAYYNANPVIMERNWKKFCQLDYNFCENNYEKYNLMLYDARLRAQQRWQHIARTLQQSSQQYYDNRMRQYEIVMKYAPKFEAPRMQLPQTYNVNLNHNIRYNGF